MNEKTMDEKLNIIYEALKSQGYDVQAQLTGYLMSGDITYITRKNNARELIMSVDENLLRAFNDSLPGKEDIEITKNESV